MKTKQQKQESFRKIKERLQKAKIVIFTAFSGAEGKGLNVANMRGLRQNLRALDSEYSVEKKTVLDKAVSGKADIFKMSGSLGIAYGYGDSYSLAKAIYQFAKKNPVMKLFGGLIGDEFIDEQKLTEMALMPNREVLLGRLVGMLNYPVRSLAIVLDQISVKLKNQNEK